MEDLKRSIIRLPGRAELLYLQDVANVYRGYIDPPSSKMRANGEPGLGLAISLREGGNILDLGREVETHGRALRATYPIGVDFDFVAFQADAVERKVDDFVGNLLQAIGIVLAGDAADAGGAHRPGRRSLIPMAIVSSFIFMSLFDVGINQMSLAR